LINKKNLISTNELSVNRGLLFPMTINILFMYNYILKLLKITFLQMSHKICLKIMLYKLYLFNILHKYLMNSRRKANQISIRNIKL